MFVRFIPVWELGAGSGELGLIATLVLSGENARLPKLKIYFY